MINPRINELPAAGSSSKLPVQNRLKEIKSRGSELSAEHVTFAYGSSPVLKEIDLRVAEGEFIAVLGPSGCGKSTLLRLLAGLEKPLTGRILHREIEVAGPDISRGVVFQDYSLFPWLNLQDNLAITINKARKGLSRKERRQIAGEYLDLVGLPGVAARHPYELSGGMQQRAAIARSLALGSSVLLMDEPFGALDPVNRVKLQDLLLQLCHSATAGKTIVFVTHDVEEAIYLGDRVVVLGSQPGRIIADIRLPFERHQERHDIFQSPEFRALDAEISHLYHEDIERQLADSLLASGEGAFI